MYKHVAKQRRLASHNKEAHLSDEDSSGDEEEQQELELGSNASDLNSEGSEGSNDDDDEMLLPSDDEQQEAEEEDDGQLQPPPPGYPTAAAALEMPIVDTALAGGEEKLAEDDEAPLICVVCPTKVLKKGKMLEVHLGSKVRCCWTRVHACTILGSPFTIGPQTSPQAFHRTYHQPRLPRGGRRDGRSARLCPNRPTRPRAAFPPDSTRG